MKRLLPIACAVLLGTAGLFLNTKKAHAFSGEDPVFGHPWYHEQITREAAKIAKFSYNKEKDAPDLPKGSIPKEIEAMLKDDPRRDGDGAAEALAWHADYLDSYLYSPIWWAAAGKGKALPAAVEAIFKRYKVSRAVEPELKNMHFDDLFSTDKVNYMWRRYASGTFAGLLWASEQNDGKGDVFAAQHILGASMHAIEDFYSHSSWIDKPERRTQTFFEYPRASRTADNLFTGAYEHDHQLGVKSHGKWIPSNFIWSQPGIKQLMEAACDPISPFSNSPECEAWKEVQKGTSMHPKIGDFRLPDSIMVYTPAGIALDNTWVADEAVKQRGLDIKGSDAFTMAHDLAVRQGAQWLLNLEDAMKRAGKEEFWKRIKDTPSSDAERQAPFENYGQFPFLFMAYGEYPPTKTNGGEEWYLRLKLHTAAEDNAGTNSDIKVRVNGEDHLLDYLPKAGPVLAYNDFEAGDNDAYVVGPFASCPDNIELVNDAADGKDLLDAAGRDFSAAVQDTVKGVGDLLLNVIGGHADKVAVNKQLWGPNELANMPMGAPGQGFNIDLNGGDEGNYRANGTIFKVGEDDSNYEFEVHIDSLSCIKESKFDRLSSEDEPFLLCALNPLPGEQQTWLSPVYQKVDTGETVKVEHGFARLSVPKSSGMLNLALTLMESDDEKQAEREELLQKFAGTYEDKLEESRHAFSRALLTTVAADWKLADIEVVAWTRNGVVREGTVLRQNVNRWIKPKKPVSFPLDVSGARNYGITTEELLPELGAGTTPDKPTDPRPTDPLPTNPPPATKPSFDLTTWVDEWDTTYGHGKLALNNGVLTGRLYVMDDVNRYEKEGDRLELRAGDAPGKLVGTATYTGTSTQVTLTLNPDGDTFTGTSTSANNQRDTWTGKRRRVAVPAPTPKPDVPVITPPGNTNPIPGVPTKPTPPGNTNPIPLPGTGQLPGNGNNIPLPGTGQLPGNGGQIPGTGGQIPDTGGQLPGTGGQTPGTGGGFRPLGEWSVQIESARVARDNQIEIVAIYKNTRRDRQTLDASTVNMLITDADGVGFRNIGNLYRAGGDPDMQPEKFPGSPGVESAAQARVLALFDIPAGTTPLKTLTIYGNRAKPLTFNLSGLTLTEPGTAVSFPITGTVGGQNSFNDFAEFGLRFDGVRRGRTNALQVFLTVKNMDKVDFRSHPGFSLDVAVVDQDGLTLKDEGNLYRATGDGLDLNPIKHIVTMAAGGEATLCYPVPMTKGTVPKQLIVTYRDKKMLVDLPAVP